jgi:hypothetical protein
MSKSKKKKPDMMQSVILTFSDGETATFTGKAIIFELNAKRTIVNVEFTRAEPLPEGTYFTQLHNAPNDN